MRSRRTSAILLAAGLLGSSNVFATAAQLPAEHRQGPVAFVSGGIGKSEAKAFKSAVKRFPLALEFVDRVGKRDEFLAGTDVKVTDAHGKTVLSATAAGPFLLARVPAGRYTVAATHDSKTMTRHVVVHGKAGQPIVFEWKTSA